MGDSYLSARIPGEAERERQLQSSALAKRSRSEYEYDDRLLTRRYGTSGYVNPHSSEDLRQLGERGSHGVGVLSLRETTRDRAEYLAPYKSDDQRRGVLPPSDHLLPADASSTLFVEGFPSNIRIREAAHIFRHFHGFEEVRFVNKSMEPRNQPQRGAGAKAEASANAAVLCFVEFDNPNCAATAKDALQGYKLDEINRDSPSLKLQFARPTRNRNKSGSSVARDGGRSERR